MSNPYNVILYGQGLFNSDPETNQKQLKAIQNSGFTTALLFTIHVWPTGDLYYGDTKAVSNGQVLLPKEMATLIQQMRQGGVTQVLASVGSADAADFAHLKTLLSTSGGIRTISENFGALVEALGIDGFDFDLEEFPLSDYTETIVKLTLLLSRLGRKQIITYCPYMQESFWLDCLARVYKNNDNHQLVSWMNLQCYSGGAGNNPNAWSQAIRSYPQPLGISDANAFVVPGYAASQQSLSEIEQTLSGYHGLVGAFMWNLGEIWAQGKQPKDYAQAIIAGLEAEKAKAAAS